ncbi:IPT/TIG domain-containing protein [Paenibacillus sp. GCM10023252]|uniref:IPT/TIG domain-containing protein n=1 Tax=Paenibacillus sp. GCM10023252 TaxID=3252649 RepID=UPI00361BEB66
MKKVKPLLLLMFTFLLALGGTITAPSAEASANYVSIVKQVNPSTITTEEEAEVKLQIQGTPPVSVVVPNDVILVIDKSGSMAPTYEPNAGEDKMTNAKNAAKGFIDLMDLTKHRVGIVDFSSSNQIGSFPLSTSKDDIKNYIDGISSNGSTATGDAIGTAIQLLQDHRPEAHPVILLLTDGDATQPQGNPYEYAKSKALEAKEAGIVFYTIALLRPTEDPATSGPNILLKEMATTANHHHFVLGSTGLSEIYSAIVREIGLASAYDVTVTDIVAPDFEIVPDSYLNNIPKPEVNGNILTWTFNELKDQTLTFTYKIRPVDKTKTGSLAVTNAGSNIVYKDYAGAVRTRVTPNVNLTVKLPKPEITSIVEAEGHPAGGETVVINGENFVNGAVVKFGANTAQNVQYNSSSQLTVTTPAGEQGTVNVTVTNPDNQKATSAFQYKADPIVTSISPNSGPLSGGNYVLIQGSYMMNGVQVKIGDKVAQKNFQPDSTYVRVFAPIGEAAGAVDVTINNPDGTSTTITGGYTYEAPPKTDPVITNISPNTGLTTGGSNSYINGSNFKSGMKVKIGDFEASTTYISDSRLRVIIPTASIPGVVDVTVLDLDNNSYVLEDAFTYTEPVYPTPTITSVSPSKGLTTGGENVYIDGSMFSSSTQVFFGNLEAQSVTYISSTRLRAKTPAATVGTVDVTVTNVNQSATLPSAYEYTEPVPEPVTILSLSVTTGTTSGGEQIYIDGINLRSGATVKFGASNATGITVISSERARVTVPANLSIGKVDVTWTNPNGQSSTLAEAYEYTGVVPTITSLSVGSGPIAGGTTVYINGTNFVSGMTVTVNGVSVPVNFISDVRLKIVTPASVATGSVPIVVTHTNGQSASFNFVYEAPPLAPAPVITSLSVTSGAAAGGNTMYINGSNIQRGAKVYFGSIEGLNFYYVSDTRIRIKVPAGLAGPVIVTVVNPDNQQSNGVVYTYN